MKISKAVKIFLALVHEKLAERGRSVLVTEAQLSFVKSGFVMGEIIPTM